MVSAARDRERERLPKQQVPAGTRKMAVTNNITDDKEKEMDRETAAVLKERVAKSTRGGYDGRNVSFMLWLFDSGETYQALLQPGVLEKMRDGYAKDTARRNKNGSLYKK